MDCDKQYDKLGAVFNFRNGGPWYPDDTTGWDEIWLHNAKSF